MTREVRKEARYSLRSGRLLVLLASFLFFALLTPVMLKVVLPQVLQSQGASPQDLSGLRDMTQEACIQIYMNDVFEIGTIVVAFTLCGLLAQEIRDNTLVLPICSGTRFGSIIGAKLLVFGTSMAIIPVVALIINYLYSGLLFAFEANIVSILRAGILQGLYMAFLVFCIILWGAVLKKAIPTGFLTLVTAFGLHFVGGLLGIQEWLPSGLLIQAQRLTEGVETSLIMTLVSTITLSLIMIELTFKRLKGMEWNER